MTLRTVIVCKEKEAGHFKNKIKYGPEGKITIVSQMCAMGENCEFYYFHITQLLKNKV